MNKIIAKNMTWSLSEPLFLGSTISEKGPADDSALAAAEQLAAELEMEEKQEIMARLITDLELKNTHLEDQLNQTEVSYDQFLHYAVFGAGFPALLKISFFDNIAKLSQNSRKNTSRN